MKGFSFCGGKRKGEFFILTLFPFADYWWFYVLFLAFVFAMLALDLGVFNRKAHVVSFKEATVWSLVWIVLALIFNFLFYQYALSKFGAVEARELGLEFLTGYVIEYSLSIDNIFIFVLVFGYFAIPAEYKHRVLFFGILGALLFRALFIALGSALLQIYWVVYLFGGFLIVTGIKMMFSHSEEIEPEKNFLIKTFKRFMPVTGEIDGKSFFVRKENILHATPLFIALLFLEATDIIFAVDSVPAIFSITNEPLVVFTSNIFAILGLRSMYFMLAGAIDRFHLLKYGLSIVLIFVGLKMVYLNDLYDGHFPIAYSLAVILGTIALSVVASLIFPKRKEE